MCVARVADSMPTTAWTWMPGHASSAGETSASGPSFEGGREIDRVHRALKRIAKARAALAIDALFSLRPLTQTSETRTSRKNTRNVDFAEH